MNYQKIAEMVNELIKKPKDLVQDNGLFSEEDTMNEFITSIQRVFSKLEVSGDILTFETIPLDYW